MKKYIYLSSLALALVLSSCSKFLDVQPQGTPSVSSYFTSDQQAIDAVDGLYERFHQEKLYGRELFWEQGAACDIVWGKTRGYNTLATFNYTGNESPLKSVMDYLSTVMARSNYVVAGLLQKQKSTPLTPIEKRSLGEAYFTRGWAHFLMAYRYGTDKQGVPFIRYEEFETIEQATTQIPPQRASVREDYRLIIEDMDKALEYLPRFEEYTSEDRGRAHKAAAVAFKAKVYAYWAMWDAAQWQEVIKMVNELEDTYGRALAPSLDKVFSSDFADFWNSEYLWSIPSRGGSSPGGTEFPGVILENKGWGVYNGWGQIKPSYDIYEEMMKDGAGNARLKRSILEYGDEFPFFGETRTFYSTSDTEAGFMINKYMDPFKHKDASNAGYVSTNGDWPTVRINFPIIRFAEMLLFRAEAYLMTGQADLATKDLNRIRTRSGLKTLKGTATTADLYHERRCELAFEFTDHLFDLKRWHRASDATLKALAEKELNAHPRIRTYGELRDDPDASFEIVPYPDYQNKSAYQDHMLVFPYPYEQVVNSNGKLKQNEGYAQ